LKFTGAGAVTLRLLCAEDDRAPLAFEVRDTGPGIAEEHLEAIFEPFRQLEDGSARRHDGSGLGLAISRSFAHALGLSIEVESRVGAGTVFRVPLRSDLLG
jgi:signal transduction histidine kinase